MIDARHFIAQVPLEPLHGSRFQPTGFPDIGAGVYRRPDGTRMLIVETAQSMANRLEAAVTTPEGEIIPELEGLSYVRARISGAATGTTTSLVEAHRLNSPWIMGDRGFRENLRRELGLGDGLNLDWRRVARVIFKYDANSLIHGVFLVAVDQRLKLARALSAYIEAENVEEVIYGGVKNERLDPTGKMIEPEYKEKSEFLGNVPFSRTEYVAGSITAHFSLDLGLLRSYGLGDDAYDLLAALALYKMRRWLDSGLRLRTACELRAPDGVRVIEPAGWTIPPEGELLKAVRKGIRACEGMMAGVTEVSVTAKAGKKDNKDSREEAEDEEENDEDAGG